MIGKSYEVKRLFRLPIIEIVQYCAHRSV